MLTNVLIVIALTILTTGLHAGGMILALRLVGLAGKVSLVRRVIMPFYRPWFRISIIVLLMFVVSVAEVTLWAGAYQLLGAIDSFEPALYFSMVTFTTLGYGEIVLDPNWRLLASCQAAIGIIMFGWTTAIVIASVQQFYFNQNVIPSVQRMIRERVRRTTPDASGGKRRAGQHFTITPPLGRPFISSEIISQTKLLQQ